MESRTKKRVIAGVVCAILAVWIYARPKPLVQFLGPAPSARFAFKSEFGGKPTLDLSLPFGLRIIWPHRRHASTRLGSTDWICGYLDWGENSKVAGRFLRAGGMKYQLNFGSASRETHSKVTFSAEITDRSSLTEMPFATSEEFRDAELSNGTDYWRIRLPVETKWGPTHRRPQSIKAGTHTVTIKPEPWPISTAPLVIGVTSSAPPNITLLLQIELFDKSGRKVEQLPEKGWLVESGRTTYVPFGRHLDDVVIRGTVYELPALTPGAPAKKGEGPRFEPPSGPDSEFFATEFQGRWNSTCSPIRRPSLPSPIDINGDPAEVGYILRRTWPFEVELDLPPHITSHFRDITNDIFKDGHAAYDPFR